MGFFDWLFSKQATPAASGSGITQPRALLIGNIGYPSAPLNGCINDTLNVNRALRDLYGTIYPIGADGDLKLGQVRILEDAPTDASIDAMKWLAETSGPKTLLTSGHGAQVPSSTEPDGFIEVFCPVDFDWSPEHMITDDQFVAIFSKCTGPFNWLSDSCHSGDLTRDMPKPFKRALRKVFPTPPAMINTIRGRRRIKRAIAKGEMNVGFVSGCKSDQTSADAFIDGNYCGAMTWYFLQALRENQNAKLKDLVKRTNELLKQNEYEQEPQAEGAYVNKPFLG